LHQKEVFYPLEVYVCDSCFLVQLQEYETPENIFGDYAYFSSYSDTWLKHAKDYVDKMVDLLKIDVRSYVIEIASNDGYLLQYFAERGIPVLGIEPARNVAEVARQKGIPTETVFFGTETAKRLASERKSADLLLGNNVLAHVPNLNDFVKGLRILLKPRGIITMEFPHLMRLMEETQFDTIYHEHFSYFSFLTVEKIFHAHGFTLFDVEELFTHGGSLRIYARHTEDKTRPVSDRVSQLKQKEREAGYADIHHYLGFQEKVKAIKKDILKFLIQAKEEGKRVVGYGAPAKGNTLLNYCGIRTDFIDYTVDRNPYKQGHFLPGSHIPIEEPNKVKETKPDYLFILPWNLKDEIMEQMVFIRQWGGKFVIPIPKIEVI
jgi:2-polyprenyl-3-methyl-5-hydroxy-6-metoxy-1,4-benzoquinol methylase